MHDPNIPDRTDNNRHHTLTNADKHTRSRTSRPAALNPSAHHGHSTIYRLLRPLALAQLVERATGVADFSVDTQAVGLLQFGATAEPIARRYTSAYLVPYMLRRLR
jgi:hypothetical protein